MGKSRVLRILSLATQHLQERDSQSNYLMGLIYIEPSSEEDDPCPACVEEYTEENPKITAKCFHHFHLGCIHEWMERSDNCPVCGKVCHNQMHMNAITVFNKISRSNPFQFINLRE